MAIDKVLFEQVERGEVCQECLIPIGEGDYAMGFSVGCGEPRWCYQCGGDPDFNGCELTPKTESE